MGSLQLFSQTEHASGITSHRISLYINIGLNKVCYALASGPRGRCNKHKQKPCMSSAPSRELDSLVHGFRFH